MPKTKVKQPKVAEPFWREVVSGYILFLTLKFEKKVTLEGSSPRDLKMTIKFLRELAEKNKVAWTCQTACRMLHVFLSFSWEHMIAPHSEKWFIVYSNQKKEEILEKIQQYKQLKQQNDKN